MSSSKIDDNMHPSRHRAVDQGNAADNAFLPILGFLEQPSHSTPIRKGKRRRSQGRPSDPGQISGTRMFKTLDR